MLGVLTGFAIIGIVITIGYLVGRFGLIGEDGRSTLNRLAFFVATPALLFTVLSDADLAVLASPFTAVAVITIAIAAVLYLVVSIVFFRRSVPVTALGAASASYVNGNNIGLPVAIYVLGDPAYVAPILLVQLTVMAPTILAVLDISTAGRVSVASVLTQPLRNPLILASAIGVIVSATGVDVPAVIAEPLSLIGGSAVPMVLIAFGMSLTGSRVLARGSGARQTLTATVIKSLIMPAAAWLIGGLVFHLPPNDLFAAVTVAALPTAQNIYNFAVRYERAMVTTRDTVLLTTLVSPFVVFTAAAVLHPV